MYTPRDLEPRIRQRIAHRLGIDAEHGIPVRAHVLRGGGALLRAAVLTPYMVETIGEDVRRGGPLARLELTLARDATDAQAAWVAERFAFLRHRGVLVTVRRGTGAARIHTRQAAYAAERGASSGASAARSK